MNSERVFQIALMVSLLTHSIVFVPNPPLLHLPFKLKKKELKVTYIKNAAVSKPQLLEKDIPVQLNNQRDIPPPFINKEDNFWERKGLDIAKHIDNKSNIIRPDIISVKKRISLPAVDMGKIPSPSYMGYYQLIREKIRRQAYANYTHTETGEVYLSFLIAREGALKEVRLVSDKSTNSSYLRRISLNSINEAAPFPAFPKDLDYKQLSFNVVISYEVE